MVSPPDPVQLLVSGDMATSRHFLENIRKYNFWFQSTSFGAKEIREIGYMSTFKVQENMPPKKEPSVGPKTSEGIRNAAYRAAESSDQREARLEVQRTKTCFIQSSGNTRTEGG